MTHTYKITGMTCANCAKSVESKLLKVPGITAAAVDLEKQIAEVTMHHHVNMNDMQAALNGTKYSIGEEEQHLKTSQSIEVDSPIILKTYLPVFLIFGYITGVTLIIQFTRASFNLHEWMSHFMAGFFLTFSFFKMLDIPAFAMSYTSYDLIAKRWNGYGYVYPFIELSLGIIFLIPALHIAANWITLIVMSVSIIGVIQSMLKKSNFQCACLGTVFKLPLSKITLVEDALMIMMSAVSLGIIL